MVEINIVCLQTLSWKKTVLNVGHVAIEFQCGVAVTENLSTVNNVFRQWKMFPREDLNCRNN